ncbi:restriction endonuclease subunit S [Cytobacillus firmus]|nr:restriction endonuclease subunit S [Cytobacillus firmus]
MKGRVNEELVLAEYMVLWINSHYGKKYIKQNATGTAGNMPKINQKVVKNILIPLPPIQEQIEIMRVVEQTNRKDIGVNIVNASKSLEIIKQSVLSKAFRGELGTNDPSEESAIELLKEILQEQVK